MNIHKKDIKEIVNEKYSQIALQSKKENETSCCGAGDAARSITLSSVRIMRSSKGTIPMRTSALAAGSQHSLQRLEKVTPCLTSAPVLAMIAS